MGSYGMAKLAQLMFAVELDRRSRRDGWGLMSNAAHPGLSKTNLLSGASYGRDKPTLQARLTQLTWWLLPFMWLSLSARRDRRTHPANTMWSRGHQQHRSPHP